MDEKNILERIHAAYYQLTTAERKVADFVLTQHDQVQFMSISQLAEECGTAEATVSRFCRSLELKGFNAFKIELARDYVATRRQQEHSLDTLEGRSHAVGTLAHAAVDQTIQLLEPARLQEAVLLLEKAPRVLCFGSGGSMVLANECANVFSTVSGKFFAIPDSHNQISAVATAHPDDVIILFSYSGATTNGIQVLELAKQLGVHTILITRFSKSPAASLADVVLRCGSNESPFQFGSIPAKIAQLIVTDLLFQEYCYRNPDSCAENIERIADALSVKHL